MIQHVYEDAVSLCYMHASCDMHPIRCAGCCAQRQDFELAVSLLPHARLPEIPATHPLAQRHNTRNVMPLLLFA